MIEQQIMVTIKASELLAKVAEYKMSGHRLVQICCTRTDVFEINYSFDKDYQFTNLRLILATSEEAIPSVSGIYWAAFLYENEMQDLFGVKVKGMVIDFAGNFYRTAIKRPFGVPRPSATGPKGAAGL